MIRSLPLSGAVPIGFVGLAVALSVAACSIDEEGLAPAGSGGSAAAGFAGATPVSGGGGPVGGNGGVDDGGLEAAPSCESGEQCVPRAPAGWDYSFLVGLTYADPAPAGDPCFDGSTPQRFFMEPEPQASCAPCTCGPLTGATCHIPLLCAGNNTCSPGSDWSKSDGDCHGDVSNKKLWCTLGGATFNTAGTCAPSGGELSNAAPWKQLADVCVAKALRPCGETTECVPKGGGKYDGFVCVAKTGELSCPADYPIQSIVYKQANDSRACSPCTCAVNPLACVGAEYTFYDDALCISSVKSVSGQSCTDLNGATDSFVVGYGYKRKSAPTVKGDCSPGGGQPSGQVSGTPSSAFTVCCRNSGS